MDDRRLNECHIAAYLQSLRGEERAAATIEKYRHAVCAFAAWLDGRPVTKDLAARWKSELLESGLSPATINGRLSALNGLLHCLGWDGCQVKLLKLQRKTFQDASRELTRAEYDRLLSAAGKRGRGDLELLMETICAAGIRVSEVEYITVEAVERGEAEIRLKDKIRTILLPGKLCRKLSRYARKQKIASGAIFRAKSGQPLSRFQIWRMMKSLCAAAGVEPSKVFPHNLRHLFAVTFYRATRDIAKLADLLGHSSIETTRIYLRTTGLEHARQLERLGLVS